MAVAPNVRLELSSRPENVVLVREMLTGVAHAIGLRGGDLSDIRTAATEACNNVVLHAYADREGPLEVEVHVAASALEIVVRDRGAGIRWTEAVIEESALGEDGAAGIGVPMIRALVRDVEFADPAGGGTEVRMRFAAPAVQRVAAASGAGLALPASARADRADTAVLTTSPTHLAGTILPRLLSVLAARAHFSTDRVCDAQLLADALVGQTAGWIDGDRLSVAVSAEPRNLRLCIGPLGAGRAQRLIVGSHLLGIGRVLEQLTDFHQVATAGNHELLTLQLTDRRG